MKLRFGAAFGLGVLALTASCEREEQGGRERQGRPSELVLNAISADVEERGDGSVSVHMTWTITGADPQDQPYAPVILSNGGRSMEGRARWIATPGGNIDYRATVVVPAELWREGCWQAQYALPGTVLSGPIDCLNLEEAAPANRGGFLVPGQATPP